MSEKLNVNEAAKLLGISVSTLHKMTMRKDVSFLRVGKRYLFDPELLTKEYHAIRFTPANTNK